MYIIFCENIHILNYDYGIQIPLLHHFNFNKILSAIKDILLPSFLLCSFCIRSHVVQTGMSMCLFLMLTFQ